MAETIQRSFTGGEITPELQSRADMVKYMTGLKRCENFIIKPQGGAFSRPGTRFIGEVRDSTRRSRLIPFQFNEEQTYILVFEHRSIQFIKNGAYILDGSGPARYELTTEYLESQLSELSYTQSADVITIAHPDHEPRNLSRLADDNWTLTKIDYAPTVPSPVLDDQAAVGTGITAITNANPAVLTVGNTGIYMTDDNTFINGVGGMTELNDNVYTVTVIDPTTMSIDVDSTSFGTYTSGGTAFADGGIGTGGSGAGDFDKQYSYVVTAVDENGVESLPSNTATITTMSLSQTAYVRLRWDAVPEADYYRVYKDTSAISDVFGWIGDVNGIQFRDYNVAPISTDAPPQDRDPFITPGNRPSAVTYFQQRQVFANTFNEPQTVFTTQTNNFNSLRVSSPTKADDAITFTVASQLVNEIKHLISLDSLVLLTSGGEFRTTEGQDQVLTPSTVGVRAQSYNGASSTRPVIVNDTALYIQEKGNKVRDLRYSFNDDRFSGTDLSIMAQHLVEGFTIEEMSYADEPYGIVWFTRNDGVLLGLTYQREHQVWAWHQHKTQGSFESLATVSEGGRDATYVTVLRDNHRYVERMEPRFDSEPEDVFCVDSGLSYDGVPADTFSNLGHLNGSEVVIVADGVVIKGKIVSGGQVTLDREYSKVSIGLAYTPVMETLDIDTSSMVETLKARRVSIGRVTLETLNSRGGWVGGRNDDGSYPDMVEIKPRYDSDGYDAMKLQSIKAEVIINSNWQQTGGLRIEQRDPMPLAITSIIPELDLS